MTRALEILHNLLSHEANELEARSKSSDIPQCWQHSFEHQKRGVLIALAFVDALASGRRPCACGSSRGAHHFDIYGELLPVCSAECFPAMPPEVRLEDGARVKFYAVHQLEADEFGVVHLCSESPVSVVCDDDRSLHESFLSGR